MHTTKQQRVEFLRGEIAQASEWIKKSLDRNGKICVRPKLDYVRSDTRDNNTSPSQFYNVAQDMIRESMNSGDCTPEKIMQRMREQLKQAKNEAKEELLNNIASVCTVEEMNS